MLRALYEPINILLNLCYKDYDSLSPKFEYKSDSALSQEQHGLAHRAVVAQNSAYSTRRKRAGMMMELLEGAEDKSQRPRSK